MRVQYIMRLLIKCIQITLVALIVLATIGLYFITEWGMRHFGSLAPDSIQNIKVNQHGLITYYNRTEFFLLEELPIWVTVFGMIFVFAGYALDKLAKSLSEDGEARGASER